MKFIAASCMVLVVLLAGCSGSTESQTGTAKTPAHLEGPEALVYATRGGDLETVKSFLDQDPSLLEAQDYRGNTLLHMAGGYNRLEVVEYLLAQGADPTLENYDGLTCFEHADSENADPAVLDLLRP